METLTISKLNRQGQEVSRRLGAGESFVLTRGNRLVGLLRPIPPEVLDSLEDVLHLNSEALAEAATELRGSRLHRPRVTEVFRRQLQEAASTWPRLTKQVEKAGAALQADRHAGAAVHLAAVAPGLAAELKDLHGKLRKLRVRSAAGAEDEPEVLIYFFVPRHGAATLLALFAKREATDIGREGLARVADAMARDAHDQPGKPERHRG
jgi:hypothetical protein